MKDIIVKNLSSDFLENYEVLDIISINSDYIKMKLKHKNYLFGSTTLIHKKGDVFIDEIKINNNLKSIIRQEKLNKII